MRIITVVLLIISSTLGQDTLFTTSGVSYIGKFIEQDLTHVVFHAEDMPEPTRVALRLIARIGRQDGMALGGAAHDTLFTTTGMRYIGMYIGKDLTHVVFHAEDMAEPQRVALRFVDRVGLQDGMALPGVPKATISNQELSHTAAEIGSPFRQGNMSAGALFSYSSSKSDADDDDPTTSMSFGDELNLYSMTIKPSFSYFMQDNISFDGILSITKFAAYGSEVTYSIYGGGMSLYMDNLYIGAGYALLSSANDDNDWSSSTDFLEFHGGYLHELARNVYLDVGANYLMGIKDRRTYNGDTETWDNDGSMFRIDVGVKAFFRLNRLSGISGIKQAPEFLRK